MLLVLADQEPWHMVLRGAARAWLVTTSGFCCAFFFAAAGGCCIRQGRQSLQGRHHGSHSETDRNRRSRKSAQDLTHRSLPAAHAARQRRGSVPPSLTQREPLCAPTAVLSRAVKRRSVGVPAWSPLLSPVGPRSLVMRGPVSARHAPRFRGISSRLSLRSAAPVFHGRSTLRPCTATHTSLERGVPPERQGVHI